MTPDKKTIAVIFGGRTPEHDVSVVTGLQVLKALDTSLYDPFPVYLSTDGCWFTGQALQVRENYMLGENFLSGLTPVTLNVNVQKTGSRGRLISLKSGLFGGLKTAVEFDAAVFAFHGINTEDGTPQGLFELAGIPYTGMRLMASALVMDKIATKRFMQNLGIPTLPFAVLRRPAGGYIIPRSEIEAALLGLQFPLILKPVHLGSSIGIAKVASYEDIQACLPAIFEYDTLAMLEPFVSHLTEYNVAVARLGDKIVTSAIERPKSSAELLDFKEKYLAGAGKSGKKGGSSSEGMLSLTRELNPPLMPEQEQNIRSWAVRLYEALEGTGAPRIDFISNGQSGEIWMNEVNPIPGSFGFFLWEAAREHRILFTPLLTHLIDEALHETQKRRLPADPVPVGARLLKRAI